jgi:hypothetical protein
MHSLNKLNKFKQKSACQKTYGNCFLGQEMSADGGTHTVMSEVYCEILKNCIRPFRTKVMEF